MKPNLILLHGTLGSLDELDRIADRFRHEFRVLTFSIDKHADLNSDENIQRNVLELDQFILDNQLEAFSLFGYSTGGYIALKYALKFTNKIDQIYTFGSRFSWLSNSSDTELKKMNPRNIEGHVPAFSDLLKFLCGEDKWLEVMNDTDALLQALGAKPEFLKNDSTTITCLITQSQKIEVDPQADLQPENAAVGAYTAKKLHQNRLSVLKEEQHPIYSEQQQHLDEIFYDGPSFNHW